MTTRKAPDGSRFLYDSFDVTAARIEEETGLTVHLFPKLKEFFIGFRVTA